MYDPHLKDFEDLLAARYALGVAEANEIELAQVRLARDDSFAARVADYDALFSELEHGTAPIEPPSGVWARIEQAIDEVEKSPFTRTVRPSQRHWEPFAPGIDRKVLHLDASQGAQIVLYKVAPGTQLGSHRHIIPEECYVLEGELEVDGVVVHSGDVHIALAGTRHSVITSRSGALLYVRADIQMHP